MTEIQHRQTQQKQAIRAALLHVSDFTSAQALHRRLVDQGTPVGLATVYRKLNDLVRNGEADVVQASGVQLFRYCGGGHHHHLVCVQCGTAVEVHAPVEEWVSAVTAEHGFTEVQHTVDIFGVCSACRAANQAELAPRLFASR